ncbi:cell wall metabolism sensor histidine kinase WalK [uncultured Brevibacillus sp.]|uniref:sensor histidine kinase n=1 Tax=uncultured Brevibacillus sp. TaxID=169970 RepID=UPI002596236F|nr:HAMP domain-containing sensor histidine kinase [uncultured Brevibacillus sp.]
MKKEKHNLLRKFLEPSSLRYQLLSRSLLILSGLLLFIGVIQYVLMQQFLYRNKAESLLSQVRTVPYQVWQNTESFPKDNKYVNALLSLRTPDTKFAFMNTNGKLTEMFTNSDEERSPRFPEEIYREVLENGECSFKYKILQDENGNAQLAVLQPVTKFGKVEGVVQVSSPIGSLRQVLVPQLVIFFSASSLALIIGLLTFLPVLRRTLNPLSHIEVTIERINAGNLDERLPVNQGQMEVDRLSNTFNGMLERLEASFRTEQEAKERMRRFIADASHELRTPLTSIHGFLEVLLRGASTNPEQLNKALKSMYGEAERLNKLVQDLLYLAKMDREPIVHMQEGKLDTVVNGMEPQLLVLAGERNVHLSITADVSIKFNSDAIRQVILNLFQNAVQFTDPKKGMIELTLRSCPDGTELTIQDNGIGISPDHIPHLFERFYRIESSRTRKSGGAGLGLAITKSIVDMHGGTIHVQSNLGEGTLFRVWLPTCNE